MGAIHQPHAAAGGAVQEPRKATFQAEVLVPGVGGEHRLTQLAALHDLSGADGRAKVTLAVRHQQLDTSPLDYLEHAVALLDGVGHRFLEEDVLACRSRVERCPLVQEVRQRDHHQRHIVASEHLVGAGKGLAAVILGERRGALAVCVEHGDQACTGCL